MSDNGVYEEVTNDLFSIECTIFTALNETRARGDLAADDLEYELNKDPKFARFVLFIYLLPKIHKRLHNNLGTTVISNCGYCTESVSSFLDYDLQHLA